jgi:ATP synthase protein I
LAEDKKPEKNEVQRLLQVISGKKKLRELRKRQGESPFWHGIAMLGVVGWTIILPTLVGIFLGQFLDQKWPQAFSWTITLMLGGLTLGFYQALKSMFDAGGKDR